jgi:hypothetical protein
MKAIIESEQQVLSSYFTLSKLPAGLALMIIWKTRNYNYVRFVDFGVLAGISEHICQSWQGSFCLQDRIATTTDIARLSSLNRQMKSRHCNKAFNSISSLASSGHAKLSAFMVVVDDNGEHVRHVSHGSCFQGESHVSLCLTQTVRPLAEHDHLTLLQAIISSETCTWMLCDQLAAINYVPAVNTSFNCTMTHKYSVAEGRFRTSCKYMMIRGTFACAANIHATGCNSEAFRRRKCPIDRADIADEDEQHDMSDDTEERPISSSNLTSQKTSWLQAPVTMSINDKFKFLLQRHGTLRINRKSHTEMEILWNKFDAVKGTASDTIYVKENKHKNSSLFS